MSNNISSGHQTRRTPRYPRSNRAAHAQDGRSESERPGSAASHVRSTERRSTHETNSRFHRGNRFGWRNRGDTGHREAKENSPTKEKKAKAESNESCGSSKNSSSSDSTVCAICYCQYSTSRIPKVMTCGHTFCAFCVQKLGEERQNSVICPTCRKATLSNYKFIPTNFQLLELLEKCNMLSKVKEDYVPQERNRSSPFLERNSPSSLFDRFINEFGDDDDDLWSSASENFEDLRRLNDQIDGLIDGIQHIRANLSNFELVSRAAELERITNESLRIAEEFARGEEQIRSCYTRYRDLMEEYNELNASLNPHSEHPTRNRAQQGSSRWSRHDEEEVSPQLPHPPPRNYISPGLSSDSFSNRIATMSTSSQGLGDSVENLPVDTPPNLGFVVRNTDGQFRTANKCTLCNCGVPPGQVNINRHLSGRKHRARLDIMNRQFCRTLGLDVDDD